MEDSAVIQLATIYEIGDAIIDTAGTTEDFTLRDVPTLIREDVYNAGYSAGYSEGHSLGVTDGKQAQYNEFWDAVQQSGKRTDYTSAFALWKPVDYIRPKYKVVPTSGNLNSIFGNNDGIKVIEKAYFDFSQVPTLTADYMCNACDWLLIFEDCGMPALTQYSRTWRLCTRLHTIEVVRSNESTKFVSAFDSCSELVNLNIEGTIGQNGLNLQWSTKLSANSIASIIRALSTTTTGLSITLSKTAKEAAFTEAQWRTLIANRTNWTINLI